MRVETTSLDDTPQNPKNDDTWATNFLHLRTCCHTFPCFSVSPGLQYHQDSALDNQPFHFNTGSPRRRTNKYSVRTMPVGEETENKHTLSNTRTQDGRVYFQYGHGLFNHGAGMTSNRLTLRMASKALSLLLARKTWGFFLRNCMVNSMLVDNNPFVLNIPSLLLESISSFVLPRLPCYYSVAWRFFCFVNIYSTVMHHVGNLTVQ